MGTNLIKIAAFNMSELTEALKITSDIFYKDIFTFFIKSI